MKHVKKITPFHVDERGTISYLSTGEFQYTDSLFITSTKGAVRANHFHKKDTHSIYLISGKCEYITKDMSKENGKLYKVIVTPGHLITTPPMWAHKVIFLEKSEFVVLTTEPRDQTHYEDDTVRLEVEDHDHDH